MLRSIGMVIEWIAMPTTCFGVLAGTLFTSTGSSTCQAFTVAYVWRISKQGNVTDSWQIRVCNMG